MKRFLRICCCVFLFIAGNSIFAYAQEQAVLPQSMPEKAPSAMSEPSGKPAKEQPEIREEPKPDKDVSPSGMTAEESLLILMEGNKRFAESHTTHPNQDRLTRYQTATRGQVPFAVIVTCSDSRVPPNIIFDQGIGDLFVIRTAGHVCDMVAAASVEYGADHLLTPLVVVLGHAGCGAVTATVRGEHASPTIAMLMESIKPAVDESRTRLPKADEAKIIEDAIEIHVRRTINSILQESPVLKKEVSEGKVTVCGAIYDIKTGKVRWLARDLLPDDHQSGKTAAEKTAP